MTDTRARDKIRTVIQRHAAELVTDGGRDTAEADPDRKEQHRTDTIGRWDPPEADWAAEYNWTRYRGPAAYPCPGAWVLDEPEGLAYSWLWFPEIGENYGTESSAFDDLEYSSIDSYREARAFLIGEDVAESLREEEIEWTLSIDNVDVFVRRELDQDELMGAVAEALSRYPDDEWRDVTPTAGSPPPEVLRERELEQRREENESLDEFATDGGQPDGGLDRVEKSRNRLRNARRVTVCRECDGRTVSRSKVGGVEHGGCPQCRGTGLMLR